MPNNGGYAVAAYFAAALIYVSYAVTIRTRLLTLQSRAKDIVARDDSAK